MSPRLQHGTVGILPVGALGVGFFFYLTGELGAMEEKVSFIERAGSGTGRALRKEGTLYIGTPGGLQRLPALRVCRPDLLACAEAGWLPEVLLVCTRSDQILSVVANFVELLEWLCASDGLKAALAQLPLLVLC